MFPGISFGAACPLSIVEKTLVDAVAKLPAQKTEVFRGVLEQLRWFAGKQVKSVAVSRCQEQARTVGRSFHLKAGRLDSHLRQCSGPQTLVLRVAWEEQCLLKCRFLGPTLRDSDM